jgi:transposase
MRKGAPRRSYPLDFKLAVLERTRVPGASVAVVARENGINANVVFGWRKLLREGRLIPGSAELTTMVPVVVTDPAAASELASPPSNAVTDARFGGVIRIELARGTVSVQGSVDTDALRTVMQCLSR